MSALPNPFIAPIPITVAVLNSSSCGSERSPTSHRAGDGISGLPRSQPEQGAGPHDSIPDPTSGSLPSVEVGKLADVLITEASAVFSDDVRIHRAMLAVADELADELRTINEAILLREFGRKA